MLCFDARRQLKLKLTARIIGRNRNHTGSGTLTEVQRLWAFQDFNLSHIQVGVVDKAAAVDHHTVKVDGHRLIERRGNGTGADATQTQIRAVSGTALCHDHVRHHLGCIDQVGNIVAVKICLGHGSYRDRNVLQGFSLPPCGNGHFFNH